MCGDSVLEELGFYSKISANLTQLRHTRLNIESAELILMISMIFFSCLEHIVMPKPV